MNTLAAKEWRENRIIIGFAALLVAVIPIVPTLGVLTHLSLPIPQSDLLSILLSICGVCALYCGSVIVAPEVGNGSLQLLSTLPISRRQIWWTKIGMGLLVMFASMVVCSIVMILITMLGLSMNLVSTGQTLTPAEYVTAQVLVALAATVFLFSVGSVVTMLSDRTLSALIGSVVTAVTIYLLTIWTVGEILLILPHRQTIEFGTHTGQLNILIAVFVLITLILFAASYRLFVSGETLKTNKRFRLLIPYVAPSAAIVLVTVIASWFVKVQ